MIYFMQAVGGGPIKIGHSVDVAMRQNQLQCHYGEKLVVLAAMDGGRSRERELHAQFAAFRIGSTEQFQPAPELMSFIGLAADADGSLEKPFLVPVKQQIRLGLSQREHRLFRIVAADAGMTMSQFAESLALKAIKEYQDSGRGCDLSDEPYEPEDVEEPEEPEEPEDDRFSLSCYR